MDRANEREVMALGLPYNLRVAARQSVHVMENDLARGRVPDDHLVIYWNAIHVHWRLRIIRVSGEVLAVGGPGHRTHNIGTAYLERMNKSAGRGIPDLEFSSCSKGDRRGH